jgi:DNA-binding response OmpR family regulator
MMNISKKVLIVEDDQDISLLVKHNLQKIGLEVFEADDGAKGLSLVKSLNPDLVILDLMLPSIDGFEFLRQLKRDEESVNIPVIIMSAKTGPGAIIKAFHLGIADYLPKPFNIGELISRVSKIIKTEDGDGTVALS